MIVINGEVWRIRFVPPHHPELMSPWGLALGCCNDMTKTIYLNNALRPSQVKMVLRHELTHAVLYSNNIFISRNNEELVANIVATYGEEIIRLSEKFA